jgi:hypothetical protein
MVADEDGRQLHRGRVREGPDSDEGRTAAERIKVLTVCKDAGPRP